MASSRNSFAHQDVASSLLNFKPRADYNGKHSEFICVLLEFANTLLSTVVRAALLFNMRLGRSEYVASCRRYLWFNTVYVLCTLLSEMQRLTWVYLSRRAGSPVSMIIVNMILIMRLRALFRNNKHCWCPAVASQVASYCSSLFFIPLRQ